MKPTYEKLKIILTFGLKNEKQENMFTGRTSIVAVPTGNIHICTFVTANRNGSTVSEASGFMMCGKTREEIGDQTKDSDKRPTGLLMCPKCEQTWKNHPDSPWLAWQRAQS